MSNKDSKSNLTKIKKLLMHPVRKRQELEKQESEGYKVEIPSGSRGEYVMYCEREKSLSAYIDISWKDGVRLYTQSLNVWETPVKGEKLSLAEYDLVVKRICDYLSLEGEVTLDDSPLMTQEEQLGEMKAMGEREGWTTVEDGGQIKFVKK